MGSFGCAPARASDKGTHRVCGPALPAALLLIGMSAVGITHAAAQGSPEARQACTPDAMRLCSEFTSDVSQTAKCMTAKTLVPDMFLLEMSVVFEINRDFPYHVELSFDEIAMEVLAWLDERSFEWDVYVDSGPVRFGAVSARRQTQQSLSSVSRTRQKGELSADSQGRCANRPPGKRP
jgi:hypothetical protein